MSRSDLYPKGGLMKGSVILGRLMLLLVGLMLLVSCAPDSSTATPVAVELFDDHITLRPTTIRSGPTVFQTGNMSTDLVHEIEVFAGGVDGGILPVSSTVADVSGLTLLDEIEDIVPGSSAALTVDLAPGSYLVLCNLPGHYQAGMWAYVTVTEG